MISSSQVTALTAQAANSATYASLDDNGDLLPGWVLNTDGVPVYIGPELAYRGIGIYGQSVEGLVLAGVLKPSILTLIKTPEDVPTALSNASVWSGNLGVYGLIDYLDSAIIQNLVQIALYQGAYQGLIDNGVITGTEEPRYIATFLQPAVKYGVNVVLLWIANRLSAELNSAVSITARQGQYAIDFIDIYGAQLNIAPDPGAFDNTTQRTIIDQVVANIIDSPKIPPLLYGDLAVANVAVTLGTTGEDGTFRFAPGAPRS
jgi:hypothetical protein